jgi:aminomuconate-semialdehyde/2-hydroxymuconate-6-semialdehyde dehydrogenase
VPKSTALDVDRAVQAAVIAFKDWKRTTRQQRSEYLLKIAARLEERLDEFALAESQDQGKPLWLATTVDIPRLFL